MSEEMDEWYIFLKDQPCPICGGIEGCDHTVTERRSAHLAALRAASGGWGMRKRNNGVTFWDVEDLYHSVQRTCSFIDGRYVPARPLGWTSWPKRLKAVWMVWTGRADIVTWPGQ